MGKQNKINIYVPKETVEGLESDNELFEVYLPDGRTINRNAFLSMLVKGYYDTYAQERRQLYEKIVNELEVVAMTTEQREMVATNILKSVFLPPSNKRFGKNAGHLSLKPTKMTATVLNRIMDEIGSMDYTSRFLCRMFMSYSEKPLSERERIIYKENYDILAECCKQRQPICFLVSGRLHEVIPYALATGPEEMFNYLLCQEEDARTRKPGASVYRLSRINGVERTHMTGLLKDDVRNILEKMIKQGPQYVIGDAEEVCVKLTKRGRNMYKKIFFGRPAFDEEKKSEDGCLQYYSGCSLNQLELYFRRFGAEAEIISPRSLRDKIAEFHRQAALVYEKS